MNQRFEAARSGIRLSSGVVLVLASLLVAQAANAQQADSGQAAKPVARNETPEATVVTVVGTRQSVASAIDRKIRNGTVSDSLVAEDINQFPDKNVGEALARITGVQLQRDFGEGSQVSIRGVEPDLNRVEINGLSVLSTSDSGRGAELRELASELIASIDVYKGSTADLTEGGVGGSVIIKTRKPLDFKKPTVAATVSGQQSNSRGGVQPRVSLLLADKFLDGRLGLMANMVYDKVYTQNDYARNTSWVQLRDWDLSPDKTVASQDPAVAAISTAAGCSASTLTTAQKTACQQQWYDYSPRNARYGISTRDHSRSSAEFSAQYKVSNELSVWGSYESNIQHQRLNDLNFGTDFTAISRLSNSGTAATYNATTAVPAGGTCVAPATNATPAGMVLTNHIVTQYTVGSCLALAGQGGQGAFSTSARDFALNIDSAYSSGGFNFKRGALEAEGLIAKSTANYVSDSNNVTLTQNAPGLKVTLDSQSLPHFTFPAGYSPDDTGAYTQVQVAYRPSATKNTEDQAKLDFKYRLDNPFFSRLWFGVQGRNASSQKYAGGGYLASNGANLTSTADDVNVLGANINQTIIYDPLYKGTVQRAPDTQTFINSSYATTYVNASRMADIINAIRSRSPAFFQTYDKVSNMPANWMAPVYAQSTQFVDTSRFNQAYLYSAPGSDGKIYPQIPTYGVQENVRSAYLRADWDTELFGRQVNGNFGARYTGTSVESTGFRRNSIRVENSPGSAAYTDRVVTNEVATVANTYHDVLPSANAVMWLVPDLFLVRAGWAKVMARPRIDLLAPNAVCTVNSGLPQFGGDGTDDCTAGNPDLKPFRARNTDLSFEYYPGADSQLSVGLFRKAIDSYIINSALVKGVDLFKTGQLFDVTQPVNGKGATTNGIELTARTAFASLPGWLSGFGIDTNYTRMTFKYAPGTERISPLDGSVLPYPGLSKNSYNAALWYDLGHVNARLAYNYRDRYYTGTNDVAGNPNFLQKTGFLDAKFQYRIDKSWTISLEGKNLTDQAQTTDAGDPFRLSELAFSGRRYFVSLSYKN